MAAHSFTALLKSGQREVATLRMDPGCGEALVGRSHRCALRTPEGDNSVSGIHAKIYWKGNALMIEDAGSRNGIYCHGSRVAKPRKVASGDIYTIGGCSLQLSEVVEGGSHGGKGEQLFHRLERMNGDKSGQQIDIETNPGEKPFTIGLDPGNSLCLADMLVSRHHAELSVHETGECWIRDLGSKNGTFVNGEVLKGRERLLKDGDKITIAYFDFRFLDKSVQHKRLFLWLKVFAIAATLCVMAGAYVVWVTQGSSADEYMTLARRYAAVQDFASAKKTLDDGRLARDADRYRAQMDALEIQLERWEKTSSDWTRAKGLLADGRLADARKVVDPLVGGASDAWMWNGTDAVEEKKRAEFASRTLRWYFDASEALASASDGQPEQQSDRLRATSEPLERFMAESADSFAAVQYLDPATNRIAKALAKIGAIHDGFARVDAAIARLDSNNPDFAKLTSELDAVVADKSLHASVRGYAEKYRRPCAELASAKAFVAEEFIAINDMRFNDVMARRDSLVLPAMDLCARHPQLSDHRVRLEAHHEDVQNFAANLDSMVRGLAEKGVAQGATAKHLRHVLSEETWRSAFAFDCLTRRPPSVRRRDPAGLYDELLGIEFTFQSIRALPNDDNGFCLRMIGFSPDIVEARSALEYVDVFLRFVDSSPKWLRRGTLGKFCDMCGELQSKRSAVVRFLRSYEGERRARIIARFYAGYLDPSSFDLASRRDLSNEFKALQRDISAMSEEYGEKSDPVEQIAIRDRILATGIPGDSQLNSKWVQKFDGGGQ